MPEEGVNTVVAVDGPAAAGKTTTCLALARSFDLHYLESGRTYRIIAFEAIQRKIPVENARKITGLCDELITESRSASLLTSDRYEQDTLRATPVNVAVSTVAKIAEVRQRVTSLIRLWAGAQTRCVIEGRDIGTTIFPAATVKFYLTARPEVRAMRRVRQERAASYENVLDDVIRRDEADMSRTSSPLVPAEDAITIDTSELTFEQVVSRMTAACRNRGLEINR
ncbi:(d)CMP kinase [Amycolatopsis sp. TNS106]|uniref:(d)CMP kinase n=1 Tax=Amycolatopsis sp. TNS106 TaxID=2861750 RepID=UPI001C56FA85|nr:(d)CMP kinase [Amycolatopsis sp. TNS106]